MKRHLRRLLVTACGAILLGGLTTAPAQASSSDPVWRNVHPARNGSQCLDSGFAGSFWAKPEFKDRGNVYLTKCQSGNKHQQWRIVRTKAPGNPLQIRNVATGMCLDGENIWAQTDWIYTFPCSPTGHNKHQLWDDLSFGGNLRSPGSQVYCLKNMSSNSAIRDPEVTNSLQMFLWDCAPNYHDKRALTWFTSTVD